MQTISNSFFLILLLNFTLSWSKPASYISQDVKMNKPVPFYIPYPFQKKPPSQHYYGNSYGAMPPSYYGSNNVNDNDDDPNDDNDNNGTDANGSNGDDDSKNVGTKDPDDEFIQIIVSNAGVLTLMNIIWLILIAIGAEIKVVGRRSIHNDDAFFNSKNPLHSPMNLLIMEGLKLGSNGTDHMCVQRAACEAPNTAMLYALSADLISGVAEFDWLSSSTQHLNAIAGGLRQGASVGESGVPCSQMYKCSELTLLSSGNSTIT